MHEWVNKVVKAENYKVNGNAYIQQSSKSFRRHVDDDKDQHHHMNIYISSITQAIVALYHMLQLFNRVKEINDTLMMSALFMRI